MVNHSALGDGQVSWMSSFSFGRFRGLNTQCFCILCESDVCIKTNNSRCEYGLLCRDGVKKWPIKKCHCHLLMLSQCHQCCPRNQWWDWSEWCPCLCMGSSYLGRFRGLITQVWIPAESNKWHENVCLSLVSVHRLVLCISRILQGAVERFRPILHDWNFTWLIK